MVWGSTYCSNIEPLEILQKRTVRIVSLAKFDAHSCPFFAKLKLIKLCDIISLYIACFMYQYSNCVPRAFDNFFIATSRRHIYGTCMVSKSTFIFPEIRTTMENLTLDILIQKFGTRLMSS